VSLDGLRQLEFKIVKLSHIDPFLQQFSQLSGKMTRNVAPGGSFSSACSFALLTLRGCAMARNDRRMIGRLTELGAIHPG
jgi:hypothetical protein